MATKDKAIGAVTDIKETYKPQRRYKRHDASSIQDEETRVHSTLLEYGRYTITYFLYHNKLAVSILIWYSLTRKNRFHSSPRISQIVRNR